MCRTWTHSVTLELQLQRERERRLRVSERGEERENEKGGEIREEGGG